MELLILFLEFLKIGAFTFGGGYATIPFIQQIVIDHGWMTMDELVNFIAISESTPGTFAVNISTFVGAKVGGVLGSIIAIIGLILPCFIVIIICAKLYNKFKDHIVLKGLLFGLTATVVGLVAATFINVGKEVIFPNGLTLDIFSSPGFYFTLIFFLISLFLLMYKKLNPIIIIGITAAAGIIVGYTGIIPI